MKDALIILGLSLLAILAGAALFMYGQKRYEPQQATQTPAPQTQPAAALVPFTPLRSGSHSSVADRANYLITSASQLAQLWKLINATGTPPAIDFGSYDIAAVFAGQKPTTGYAITVSKIEDALKRTVIVDLVRPGPNCTVGQSLTSPYQLVKLPETSLPVTHEDKDTVRNCN